MKKLLAMLMAMVMVVSLTACGDSKKEDPAPATTKAANEETQKSDDAAETKSDAEAPATPASGDVVTYEEGAPLQIAYIGWGFVDQTALMYLREFDLISSKFDVTYTLSDAWGTSTSAEDIVEVLPSLIEGGAQAVIVHSMSAKIVEICNDAGVYFTLSGEVILDEELQALCDASPYYVGTVALGDYNGGYAEVKYLAETEGITNMVYLRESNRNLEENRMKGAKQAAEDYGVEWLGDYTGKEQDQALRDFAATYPELEAAVFGNGSSGMVDTAAQVLDSLGKGQDIALSTICSPVETEEYFDDGTLNLIMAGEAFEPFICSMLLVNAMYGHRVDDAPLLDYVEYFPVTDSAKIAEYSEFFSEEGGKLPVTEDAVVNEWYKPNNPDLNNEWISNWLKTEYNLDSMKKAHGM